MASSLTRRGGRKRGGRGRKQRQVSCCRGDQGEEEEDVFRGGREEFRLRERMLEGEPGETRVEQCQQQHE